MPVSAYMAFAFVFYPNKLMMMMMKLVDVCIFLNVPIDCICIWLVSICKYHTCYAIMYTF